MAQAGKRHGRILLVENAIETATVTRSKVSTGMVALASEGTCPILELRALGPNDPVIPQPTLRSCACGALGMA